MENLQIPSGVAEQNQNPETSTPSKTKIMANRSEEHSPSPSERGLGGEAGEAYTQTLIWLNSAGQKFYGPHFRIFPEDHLIITKLLCYFRKDQLMADKHGINLKKGILLTGPIGCGKSSLMSLMRYFQPAENRFIVKPCRDVSFEFIRDGYETVHKYTHNSFRNFEPVTYCFDDLGTENNLKYFGNECNVMAEVLLSRYDLFVSRKLVTHLTTNLSASEIEALYGNRVRSRMREQFNLIAFSNAAIDRRK